MSKPGEFYTIKLQTLAYEPEGGIVLKRKRWAGLLLAIVMVVAGCSQASSTGGQSDEGQQGDKPLTLYFVRHGETHFNKQGRMQGWSDSPLTEKGKETAIHLGKGLADIPFVAAYSSTSERAIDTAQYILDGRSVPLITDKNLREINFGEWEAESAEKIMEQYPAIWEFDPNFKSPVGGESIPELLKRTQTAVERIIRENKAKGGNVLVVTHGLATMNFIYNFDPQSISIDGPLPNGSVTTVEWKEGSLKVQKVGDQSFIKKGEQQK
ncbi:UNVERIFIED_CONTAM: broad specificity phosphatase PhoE [Brevibacillus sp. OAP136]